ncbi:MAG: sigma 54-interacting transcriptional regulator [Deltaproteobacteria bacterium]|jgi:arginine utilization regulatory protein|nr:sigma 54-interacting transcriptional regulator [Deltaproteobacteria bacterium]
MIWNEEVEKISENMSSSELLPQMFDNFPIGVTVMNLKTEIVYYNEAQATIDEISQDQVIGKTLLELYRVNDNTNYPTLQCLFSRKPLINFPCFYYTHYGKLINSLHNVYPLFNNGKLIGSICFISEFGKITKQFHMTEGAESALEQMGPNRSSRYTFDQIKTNDEGMRRSLAVAMKTANSLSPIMLYGETGSGKEMFAQAIHEYSERREKPFVAVNCASIPESLLEGILFGTVKGAFTGAQNKAGLLELADGGTIFLDEVNSMPFGLQSKMLRAIQERAIRRVGDSKEKAITLKIISATNSHPNKAVAIGELRADFFYRLGVVIVSIPPLRERDGDIQLLSGHFVKKLNKRLKTNIKSIHPEVEKAFLNYSWPGNVRELEHAIESAMNLAADNDITLEPGHFASSLFADILANPGPTMVLTNKPILSAPNSKKEEEIKMLTDALEMADGVSAKAAKILNISPQLFNYRMKKFGLKRKHIIVSS